MRVLIFSLLVAVASAAYIAPLYKSQEPIPGSYLIKIKNDIDIDQVATSLESLLSSDGRVVRRFKSVFHGLSARLNGRALGLVQRLEAVEYIEENGLSRAQELWNLDRIDQTSKWLDGSYNPSKTGAGVTVYVLDTGVNINHNDIKDRASYGYDAVSNDMESDDCNGHGSHCAGTVGGAACGVAKNVNLVAVRVLGCLGFGSNEDILAGIDWVVKNAAKPAVISYSIGGATSLSIDNAFSDAINEGIICSVAAGNEDQDACNSSPGRAKQVITVAATDSSDARSIWTNGASNWGDCVDLFAPGSDIVSLSHTTNWGTVSMGGTSMACPHVSGAAALILSDDRNRNLSHSAVKKMILDEATENRVSDEKGSPNLLLFVQ